MFGFLAQLLNWCYTIWPDYLGMIIIFTLILMVVITPFTVKGMRSAAEMSRLQPEIKKLQDQYKNDRIKQNEEMQALFKEHGVNPLGGCLPTLLPLPIFFIVFRLLERLNGHKTGAAAPLVRLVRHQVGGAGGYVAPHYLSYPDKLTQSIINHGGVLHSLGFDLASTARAHHSSVGQALPYYILIVVMTASQYWQQRQINKRNPAAANANPQMKLTMQLFPAFYALISLNIPAAVVWYLLISGLFRMAQNAISYRYDPVLKNAATPLPASGGEGAIEARSRPKSPAPLPSGPRASGRPPSKPATPAAPPPRQGGFMERLRAQAAEAKAQAERTQADRAAAKAQGGGRTTPSKQAPSARAQGGAAPGGNGRGGRGRQDTRSQQQPGQAQEQPGRAQEQPGRAQQQPGRARQEPERAQQQPERAQPRPGRPEPAPAQPPPTPGPAPSVAEQIAAEEAEIDAAIDSASIGQAPEPAEDGNGSPGARGASPLRVTRPSGRPAPQKGRRPRPGQ